MSQRKIDEAFSQILSQHWKRIKLSITIKTRNLVRIFCKKTADLLGNLVPHTAEAQSKDWEDEGPRAADPTFSHNQSHAA